MCTGKVDLKGLNKHGSGQTSHERTGYTPGDKTELPAVKAKPLEGKRGLIVGIANDQSIAWVARRHFARSARNWRSLI